jgi:hypothetical protein
MFGRLRYKRPEGGPSRLLQHVVKDEVPAQHTEGFRWATALAEFGMLLHQSEHRGDASVAHVLDEARGAVGGTRTDGARSSSNWSRRMVALPRALAAGREAAVNPA